MGHRDDIMLDRACAALIGVAMGDALGMPTQTLSPERIAEAYGRVDGFVAPFPDHPVSHGLSAGQVTDDTEQTMLLAHRLIEDDGEIDDALWATDLLDWEASVRDRELRDLLGPSSKAALQNLLSGMSPAETGRSGTTNGAAMRIAPVGIMSPAHPVQSLVAHVERACRLTHNTGEAIAAASAVAAVISCGIDGQSFDTALGTALDAAREGQRRGHAAGVDRIAQRIAEAVDLAGRTGSARDLAEAVGTSVASHQSVPTAFGVVRLASGDPWKAALLSANIGDDTDTIGAMACAMAAACTGRAAFPPDALAALFTANTLEIEATAAALLALRRPAQGDTDSDLSEATT